MKTMYIYILLIFIIFINFVFFIYSLKVKKREIPEGNHKEGNENIKPLATYNEEQFGKTEALGDVPVKHKANTNMNNDIRLPGVPNLEDEDKTEMLAASVEYASEEITGGETETLYSKEEEIIKKYAVVEYSENGYEKEFIMTENIICIGRDNDSCDLVINDDKFVGRQHALLYYKNSSLYFVDLNSRNGSFIEEKRLFGQKEITEDTKVKLGNTDIFIKVGE
ncbi:FHA domain-containing protein [Clostridium pasteurianum DSM 525 = ATCC 6013]|uniref:FHA domain-containing protein n=1 Tax=Clostridium pasteurianum DSM 525 = ATCC 6013 TaxID=1262449 RepID=A0A0H3J230_CLOPA|nr:FHA domain-containing protein [Clostridium pasteurianum]AJA46792.1 FHA domain-containing protein [Clostridium pasteurianum DSM 525 = ATCC 6013]AJA50780.1 FHA domain-containing protein [Clostridium pasteurianum DSM 525 = ATCC 6013]AOZ74186.1 hypothetical protein AQ983_03330 [Clostridium pasteurianum DSM 525 = ATCC 6013]AOZ77984.1 hypothetical protein AQ984_03330 [Clostridium pasteurianum]ELP58597.1 FHA domain-containing protein [Clostridium pasteurianum DSM 525 = ATCC 6013]